MVLYSTCGGQSSLKARQELSTNKEFIVLPGGTWLLITHTPRSSWRRGQAPYKPPKPCIPASASTGNTDPPLQDLWLKAFNY